MVETENDSQHRVFKIVVLGNGTVGKSSLISRVCDDAFVKDYKQTVGVDFYTVSLRLPSNVSAQLQLWDIGGQSISSKMIPTYVYEAHGVSQRQRALMSSKCRPSSCTISQTSSPSTILKTGTS